MARETAVLCLHQEETGLKSGVRLSFGHPPTPPAAVVCDPIQHGGRQLHGTFAHFSTWVSAHYPLSDSLYPLHINFACQPAPAVFYFHASRNFGSCNSVPPLNLTRPPPLWRRSWAAEYLPRIWYSRWFLQRKLNFRKQIEPQGNAG